jgi:predicted ArsR family transcriptional regulator
MTGEKSSDPGRWALVHLLAEPTRRRVYEAVRGARTSMSRDEVAAACDITRRLAAFHLDLLADAGLLTVAYARPPGRTGPGAGRPAKRYAAADVDLEISVPPRRYDIPARILARAIEESPQGDTRAAAVAVAAVEGEEVGRMRRTAGKRMSAADTLDVAGAVLDDLGYDPDRATPTCVRLRNCPFHAVVDVAPQLVCTVNDAFLSGLLSGLGGHRSVSARLDGEAPDCCVTIAQRRPTRG